MFHGRLLDGIIVKLKEKVKWHFFFNLLKERKVFAPSPPSKINKRKTKERVHSARILATM